MKTLLEAITDLAGIFDPEDVRDAERRRWFLDHPTATWDGRETFLQIVRRLGLPLLN